MKKTLVKRFRSFWNYFIEVIKRPEMAILPGQLAFFFVLALVPTLTLISYGATFLNLSTDVFHRYISSAFSVEIADLILNTSPIEDIGLKFIFTIIVGYYIASNGASSIIVTSNTIYGEKDRGFLKRRLKAIVITLFLIAIFLFMLVVPIFGNKFIELVGSTNISDQAITNIIRMIKLLQGPVTWFIIFLIVVIIYTVAPNRQVKGKNVMYGALFTSIGWVIATYIYSFYISHYANYETFYGGLANLVILMLWFYFLAFIFTIGMALNYRKEKS